MNIIPTIIPIILTKPNTACTISSFVSAKGVEAAVIARSPTAIAAVAVRKREDQKGDAAKPRNVALTPISAVGSSCATRAAGRRQRDAYLVDLWTGSRAAC